MNRDSATIDVLIALSANMPQSKRWLTGVLKRRAGNYGTAFAIEADYLPVEFFVLCKRCKRGTHLATIREMLARGLAMLAFIVCAVGLPVMSSQYRADSWQGSRVIAEPVG